MMMKMTMRMNMMMVNYFCGMVDRRRACSLISSRRWSDILNIANNHYTKAPLYHLLSCEFDSLKFKLLYSVILYWYHIRLKSKFFYNMFIVFLQLLAKILMKFLLLLVIMKNIVVFPALSKFAGNLICWVALGSASRACHFLNSIASIL